MESSDESTFQPASKRRREELEKSDSDSSDGAAETAIQDDETSKRRREELEKCDSDSSDGAAETAIQDDEKNVSIFIDSPEYMTSNRPIGDMEFESLVKSGYYVDKSDFIETILNLEVWAIAIFRQRNAMKTTHLRSLESYCDFMKRATCFENLKVNTNHVKFNQLSVLWLSLEGIRCSTNSTNNDVEKLFRNNLMDGFRECLQRYYVEVTEIESMSHHLRKSPNISLLRDACYLLFKKFGKQVLILVDNIEVPFVCCDLKSAEVEFENMFNYFAARHHKSVFKIVMMGAIIPRIFFKTSSVGVRYLVDSGYESNSLGLEYFMFTSNDIALLCEHYEIVFDEAIPWLRKRYGGYLSRDLELFNPFSIISFFCDKPTLDEETIIYWNCFNSKDILHSSEEIQISAAEKLVWTKLLDGQNGSINANLVFIPDFSRFFEHLPTGLFYLLRGGYLTVSKQENHRTILRIPNEEVKQIFLQRRKSFMSPLAEPSTLLSANKHFNEGNFDTFCSSLNDILVGCSSRTFDRELAYHVFLLVTFSSNTKFDVLDEPKTGYGYSDIILKPKTENACNPIVIEIGFLRSKQQKVIDKMFTEKFKQVANKQYGRKMLSKYNQMDVIIIIGCDRSLCCRSHKNRELRENGGEPLPLR